ncbi:MAG: hypothetical protein QOJ27_2242 [Sphingomonadales bacterium]|nr:hypothetical protein [Sphingomonadales bacterium]
MGNRQRPRDGFGRFMKAGDGAAGEPDGGGARPGKAAAKTRRGGRPAGPERTIKWTKASEAIFFRELAMVCNVRSALRKARLLTCSSLAYERRKTDARFRAAWEEAIDQSYAMLDLEMLERIRFGGDRPPPRTEAEKRLRAIPNALALQLLKLYQNRVRTRAAPPARSAAPRLTPARGDALRRQLEQMLSDFNRRMGGNG